MAEAITVKQLTGDDVLARDGRIGSVDDVYFDDQRWAVRYLVVNTGGWLSGRRVLVSPAVVESDISDPGKLRVALQRQDIESAPSAESDRPVSRQQEMAQAAHFGYPYYWSGPLLWGASAYPAPSAAGGPKPTLSPSDAQATAAAQHALEEGDPHLRSGAEVIGYGIQARDGAIGEVKDFVVAPDTWAIHEVVVDTTKWWPGGEVSVHPEYIERIDWNEKKVHVRLTQEEVKRSGARSVRR